MIQSQQILQKEGDLGDTETENLMGGERSR